MKGNPAALVRTPVLQAQTAFVDELLDQRGVMNDFVLSTQFRVFVAQCVKTMGTSRHNFADPVGIQRANVLSRLHLKKEFVPGTAGRIPGAGFLGPQDGEG